MGRKTDLYSAHPGLSKGTFAADPNATILIKLCRDILFILQNLFFGVEILENVLYHYVQTN